MQEQFRCVQFVPYEIIHRAAREMDAEQRKYEIWQDEFEQHYNIKFGQLQINADMYTMIFPSDEDYTMFMLRWG